MKKPTVAGLAILIALSPAACVRTAGRYAEQLYIEVSASNGLEDLNEHQEGLRLVGEELGVKTEFSGPADYDPQAMAMAIAEAVTRKPAGIMVVGWDESLNLAVDQAVETGVPVVTVGADLPASKRLAFVGASNLNAGALLGQWLVERLNNQGDVALLGDTALAGIRARLQGVKSALDASGLRIVRIGDSGGGDAGGAARTAAAILLQFPELDALIGIDSGSSLGIGEALKETGLVGRVLATGFGRGEGLLELIDQGVLTATVVQRTALMPYYGTLILWQLHNSGLALRAGEALEPNLPAFVDTGTLIVDKEQSGAFRRSSQDP